MWRAARERGIDAPDWPGAAPPSTCRLHPGDYRALLAARTTGIELDNQSDGIRIHAPSDTMVQLWTDTTVVRHSCDGTPTDIPYPVACSRPDAARKNRGGAVFTRGDHFRVGWLSAYNAMAPRRRSQPRRRTKLVCAEVSPPTARRLGRGSGVRQVLWMVCQSLQGAEGRDVAKALAHVP